MWHMFHTWQRLGLSPRRQCLVCGKKQVLRYVTSWQPDGSGIKARLVPVRNHAKLFLRLVGHRPPKGD